MTVARAVATLTVCAVALVADAQVPLRCGPAGRGRAAADGARGAPAVAPPAPPPTAPTAQSNEPMIVGAAWVPSGPDDEVGRRMAQQARQFVPGLGVASDLIRATIRQGMEGVMVPGQLQSGYCCRIIAVADSRPASVDLFLHESTGRQVDADVAAESFAMLGRERPVCFFPGSAPQGVQLRIRSLSGTGAVGVQMFARPFNGHVQ